VRNGNLLKSHVSGIRVKQICIKRSLCIYTKPNLHLMRLFGAPFYDVMIKIVVLLVAFQAITIKQSTFPSFTVLSLVELFAGPEKKPKWSRIMKVLKNIQLQFESTKVFTYALSVEKINSKVVCNCRKDLTQLWS